MIPLSLQDFVDELHENPIFVATIVLVEVGALLLHEALGVRDDRLFREQSPDLCARGVSLNRFP